MANPQLETKRRCDEFPSLQVAWWQWEQTDVQCRRQLMENLSGEMYLSGDNMKCGSGYTISYCALEYSIVINSCKSPSYMHRKWDLYNNLKDTTLHREVIMQKRRGRICDFLMMTKNVLGSGVKFASPITTAASSIRERSIVDIANLQPTTLLFFLCSI